MGSRRMLTGLLLLLLLLVSAACTGGAEDMADSGEAESTTARAESGGAGGEVAREGAGDEAAPAQAAAEGEAAADSAIGGTAGDEEAALPVGEPISASTGERVIKDGTVTIEVESGRFDTAYAAVIAEARTLGGSVVSSSTSNADDGGNSGSITVRVPVQRYEDLLVGVAEIGEIRQRSISAEDVSTEYVDLQSRQRHLEAQERFYLGLLEEAQDVQDAIAVQQQLDSVQGQLEQVKGRLQYLDERTSFSTLTVELFEPGATLALSEEEASLRPSLSQYWVTAQDAFVNTVGTLLVATTFLLPVALIGAAAAIVWRAVRRRPEPASAE